MPLSAETRLSNVLFAINDTLDGMIARPRMYGNAQTLEMEFITLLDIKEVALGINQDAPYMKDRWMQFVDEIYPKGPRILFLSGRREWVGDDFLELAAHFKEFRRRFAL
jgi:hypothetical protein